MTNEIHLYTDGASTGKTARGGWGYVAIRVPGDVEILRGSAGQDNTTNNRMELMAVIAGLTDLLPSEEKVVVHSDSQYVIGGFANRWVAKWKANGWISSTGNPVKNQDLWEHLDSLVKTRNIEWRWVRGHSENKYNDIADALAVAAKGGKTKPKRAKAKAHERD